MASSSRRYPARILRPIPYDHGETRQVAPVGAYEVAEEGEHLHFFSEDGKPFRMDRNHALEHHRAGHLTIEDWES
jgi:hypothetical protein